MLGLYSVLGVLQQMSEVRANAEDGLGVWRLVVWTVELTQDALSALTIEKNGNCYIKFQVS